MIPEPYLGISKFTVGTVKALGYEVCRPEATLLSAGFPMSHPRRRVVPGEMSASNGDTRMGIPCVEEVLV